MAVPKSKITKMKRGFRRSHDALTASAYVEDKDSGELKQPGCSQPQTDAPFRGHCGGC